MLEVRIHKFETHYQLPRWALAEQRRLDQVKTKVLDEAFVLALERAGVPEEGELCIRSLFAPIGLRLSNADASLALDWSLALATAISRARCNDPTANVIFYQSRRQALMDMAVSVSRGDLRRSWAWRQLGLWSPTESASESETFLELVRMLCADSAMVVPALRAVAEAELLERVASRLTESQWETLAFAALSTTGATHLPGEAVHQTSSRALRDALRVLKGSRLLRAIASSCPLLDVSAAARRAVAALAVLDLEPILLRTETAPAVISIIAEAIHSGRHEASDNLAELVEPGAADLAERRRENEFEAAPDSAIEPNEEETKPLDHRRRGLTQFGGLLFLLGLIEDLKLPEEILANAVIAQRPFLWVVHQLALALAAIEPNDAAALAFAGLSPDAPPLSEEQPAPNEIEAGAINTFVARIVERLRSLLKREDESETNLLEFVCRRRAEIVADPGWIEVRFSLDDVSTEIRRAGLDLDPGYVAWLGVVVRFVYE